jgi:hypothetical protein
LRADLAKAADSLNEVEAPERLLFELALRIQSAPAQVSGPQAGNPDTRYRQHLISELPKLLGDHVFKTRLLERNGVIDRLAAEALRGRASDQKERPYEFVEGDIPTDVSDMPNAGSAARDIYAHLVGSPALLAAAVSLLNEQLEPAIRNLFGMGGQRLSDVMRSVRVELMDRDMELILLIEDFALLQGIQRELLDAIIEAPIRDNRKVLCSIRAAMAVTTGYFASLDTARTRAAFGGYSYSLDIPYSQGADGGLPYAIDMIGGYLNAARVGSEPLDRALARTGPREAAVGRTWIPNACDSCPMREDCNASFGVSSDGYGLYPFNRDALERMLLARTKEHFDPRDVLDRVVLLTLGEQHQDLADGRYPAADYLRTYTNAGLRTMDPEIVALIGQLDPQNARRRVDILTFWGHCPDGVVNLPAGIHEAFRLPELDAVAGQLAEVDVRSAPAPAPASAKEDRRLLEDLEEVRKWGTGQYRMSQDLARRLRRWIHLAVGEHIEWNEEFWRANDAWTGERGQIFRASSVRIPNAHGGGSQLADALAIEIPITNESERVFRGLVQFHFRGNWNFERGDGPAVFRLYCSKLDEWASIVLTRARPTTAGTGWDPIAGTVGPLLLGAGILRIRGSRSNATEDLIDALLSPAPATTDAQRGAKWGRLVGACTEGVATGDSRERLRDRLLEHVGVAQGTGKPLVIDVSRLLPALRDFRASWMPQDPGAMAPPGVQRHVGDLTGRLRPALEEELSRLKEWHTGVVAHVGSERDSEAMARAVRSATNTAKELGVLGPAQLVEAIDEAVRAFRKSRVGVIDDVAEILANAESWPLRRLIAELAEDRGRPMSVVAQFVEVADAVLRDSSARVAQQTAAMVESSDGERDAIRAIGDELERIAKLMGEGGEPDGAAPGH